MEAVFSLRRPIKGDAESRTTLYDYSAGPVKVPGPWSKGRPKGASKVRLKQGSGGSTPATVRFKLVDPSPARRKRGEPRKKTVPVSKSLVSIEGGQDVRTPLADFHYQGGLRYIAGLDPFDSLPVKLEPYMYDLLMWFATSLWKQMYTVEALAEYNPITEYWMPKILHDSALCHSIIGCADYYSRNGYQAGITGETSLRHLQESMSIVNQRLSDPAWKLDEPTVVVITSMAMIEKQSLNLEHWHIHMRGLKRLIRLHGGLDAICSDPMARMKIYRADLYGALDSVQAPYFPVPEPLVLWKPQEMPFRGEGFEALGHIINENVLLQGCIHQLEEGNLFWSRTQPTGSQAAAVRWLLTRTQYTLLSSELCESYHGTVQEAFLEYLRIALVVYSLTILRERPSSALFGTEACSKLRQAFNRLSASTLVDASSGPRDPSLDDLHLWVAFLEVALLRDAESDTKSRAVTDFWSRAASQSEEMPTYQDIRRRLGRFMWVPCTHSPTLRSTWNDMQPQA